MNTLAGERYVLSFEGMALNDQQETIVPVYILLTDTKTRFSRISRLVTKDPYNHVSLSLTEDFQELYTYALVSVNGMKGGLKLETREMLKGANYSLYRLDVTESIHAKLVDLLEDVEQRINQTRYNHLALINLIFKRNIFDSGEDSKMVCSQFVTEILKAAGVELFNNRHSSTIRPYEFVKSKLLKHVKRGKI